MKAARFYEKHKLIIDEVPCKEPNDNEVLIRVHYCGICGTDVHIYEGEKGSAEVTPPSILGHELSGQVVNVGKNVKKVKAGDRVSVDPNDYCGKCYHCTNGRKHLCRSMVGIGTVADGGFAEYITAPEHLVYKFPDTISYEAAAMIEPISCCLHGINMTDIHLGDTVMIVGTGNIGLIMTQMVKYMGAAEIIAVEPSEVRRKRAIALGATIAIDPMNDDTDKILSDNHIDNIDAVIDCAGRISTAEYSVKYAGKGATVMLFGLTGPDDEIRVKPFDLFKKELIIKASFVNPDSFDKSIRLLSSGIVKVDSIITDIVDMKDIQSVFENKTYAKDGKVLIKCIAD